MTLADDLGRWEHGSLSTDELSALHPGRDVGALVMLHAHVTELGRSAVPDPGPAWGRLAVTLPARTSRVTRLRKLIAGAAVVGVIAVPTMSFAASTTPGRAIARHVGNVLRGPPAPPATAVTVDRVGDARSTPNPTTPEPTVTEAPPAKIEADSTSGRDVTEATLDHSGDDGGAAPSGTGRGDDDDPDDTTVTTQDSGGDNDGEGGDSHGGGDEGSGGTSGSDSGSSSRSSDD